MFAFYFLGLLSVISGFVLNSSSGNRVITLGDDPCIGKPDGIYPLRDVFKYLTCKDGKSTYVDCPNNSFFVPGKNLCVNASTQNPNNFCEDRWNDDFVDPWNCHKFFKCFNGITYSFDCQSNGLVFNPYLDQCVYDYEYSCHQLSLGGYETKQALKVDDNPCASQSDGNYTISDVFAYLHCDAQKASYVNCSSNELFDSVNRKCADGALFNVINICEGKSDGQYRNPWNCHGFVSCVNSAPFLLPCPEKYLVYDPYINSCESSESFTCKELPTVDNPCNGKADGNYSLPDIFTYLSCKSGVGVTISCPQRSIFDPFLAYCIDISNVTTDKFCLHRKDGDYMSPWSCYRYLQCTNGLTRDYPCLINGFVFNPQRDLCVRFGRYPCFQSLSIAKLDAKESPCANKSDGKYYISDVFAYLRCTSHQESYVNCSQNQIFDPIKNACTKANKYNINNICNGRIDAQYRNPWNCNSFISCVSNKSYQMPCQPGLVYNPYTNQCASPSNFTCRQLKVNTDIKIGDICTDLPDGNYATRNVFQILQCKGNKSYPVDCPKDQVYIPGDASCTDASQVNIDNFCNKRSEGNWQNPWNCHSFLTCHSGQRVANQNCSLFVTLNYDPITDACDYPAAVPCVQLSAFPKKKFSFGKVAK